MKKYEIRYEYSTTVVVEADDEAHARDVADDAVSLPGGVVIKDVDVEMELKTDEAVAAAIKASPMHAYDGRKTPYCD